MAFRVELLSETEKHEAKQLGTAQTTGDYYNAEKTVQKFINVIDVVKGKDTEARDILNDPTITGFKMFFHFASKEGLLADEIYPNSALRYLQDVGDTKRYELLKIFRSRLSEINVNQPYLFHTIEGLREIFTNPWDAVSFFNTSNKLIINTYETLDLKIATLNRMWREIYWDKNRGVMVLPENLREFSMSVYLLDVRVFKTQLKVLRTIDNNSIKNISHMLFDIGNCQFKVESGGAFFDTVTNMSVNETFNNLVIGFDTASVSGLSPTMTGSKNLSASELKVLNTSITNEDKKFNINKIVNDFATKVVGRVREYGISQASYFIQQQARLAGISSDTTNLLKGIKTANVDNFAELAYGNVKGAVITNLLENLGETEFPNGFDRSTLTGNEPSLQLDTKQL